MTADWKDDEDDFPPPLESPEELERARKAYDATFQLRRKVLRYGYLVLGLLILLVIILAITR